MNLAKPLAATRRLERHKTRVDRKSKEDENKKAVRKRDQHRCRFPLCGCRRLMLRLEVSHEEHKGMGGNPEGDRSTPDKMLLLCVQRHQDGIVSRHRGTIRVRPLTADGTNGPVAWDVDSDAIKPYIRRKSEFGYWFELARESAVQTLEPLKHDQERILLALAEMKI